MLGVKKRKDSYTKNNKKPKKVKTIKKPKNKKVRVKMSIMLYSLFIVITCVYLLSRYAYATELQMIVYNKEKEIILLEDKKGKLKLELEEIKDSGWIEEQAKIRMNMRKASGDQIIFLDVK